VKIRLTGRGGRPTIAISVLLAFLSMVSPLSIDTFLPSFPAIAEEFNLTPLQVQQIITAYLLPFACFALVHGPLSDALGRRRVVVAGLLLYTVGSIGCLVAPTFGLLLAFRVMQGIAAGIGPTVARAVVRDLFDGANAQRLMSNMMLVFSIAPAAAPIIGGWVHVALGWRSVFGMLVVLGLTLSIITYFALPETHPASARTRFHPITLVRTCWRVTSRPAYLLFAIAAALAMASLFIYVGSAPAIIIDHWHLSETQFHKLFFPIVGGFVCASFAAGRFAGRVPRTTQTKIGFGLLCASALIGVTGHLLFGEAPIPMVQIGWFLMACGAQLIYPVLSLEMLDMFPKARGAAASVQSFIALAVGAIVMGLLAPLLNGDLAHLALFSLTCGVVAWSCWRWGHWLQRHDTRICESVDAPH
jgi:DHA1 family bicyclomycin/chloramphenicol resistance-like MFS transporter